jgi:endonuclease YncB( thermonuclease family)
VSTALPWWEVDMRVLGIAGTALVAIAVCSGTGADAAAAAPADDRNCSDFSSQKAAQDYFLARGGPDSDPDSLDSDGNGVACESLPCPCSKSKDPDGPGGSVQTIEAKTLKVFSGNTLRVRAFGARRPFYTVRLLGLDTPRPALGERKAHCGGVEATASLARLSFKHLRDSDGDGFFDGHGSRERRVTLTTDASRPLFDKGGRLLAYARVRGGGDLAAAQLSRGWARFAAPGRSLTAERRYKRAEQRARTARRGVWRACGGDFHRSASRRRAPATSDQARRSWSSATSAAPE